MTERAWRGEEAGQGNRLGQTGEEGKLKKYVCVCVRACGHVCVCPFICCLLSAKTLILLAGDGAHLDGSHNFKGLCEGEDKVLIVRIELALRLALGAG